MDMQFEVEAGYEPGHVSMYYGNGFTTLATLTPVAPKEGDYRATYTVNGEWRFRLNSEYFGSLKYDVSDPSEFARFESAVKDTSDGEEITFEGDKYIIEWVNNNWLEVFADVYHNGEWTEVSFELDENEKGPTPELIRASLEETLDYLRANSNENQEG